MIVAPEKHCKRVFMVTEKTLLAVIAIATSAIALKLWTQPEPVSYKAFEALAKQEQAGADPKKIDEARADMLQRIPYVRIK